MGLLIIDGLSKFCVAKCKWFSGLNLRMAQRVFKGYCLASATGFDEKRILFRIFTERNRVAKAGVAFCFTALEKSFQNLLWNSCPAGWTLTFFFESIGTNGPWRLSSQAISFVCFWPLQWWSSKTWHFQHAQHGIISSWSKNCSFIYFVSSYVDASCPLSQNKPNSSQEALSISSFFTTLVRYPWHGSDGVKALAM